MKPERAFELQVIAIANSYGWRVWHFSDSRKEVRPGVFVGDRLAADWPDLALVHLNGRRPEGKPEFLLRELKSETGRLTAGQRDAIEQLKAAGLDVAVWRPEDIDSGRIASELRPW